MALLAVAEIRAGKYKYRWARVLSRTLGHRLGTWSADRPGAATDVGAQLSGDLFGGAVTYAAGIFNECRMNQWGFGLLYSKDGAARIFIQPFRR